MSKRLSIGATCLAFLAFMLATTGCVRLEKKYPDKRLYLLTAARPGAPSSPTPGAVLAVRSFRVSPPYEGKNLLYHNADQSYESDFYHEFLVPPSQMITERVTRWMTDCGLFEYVVDPTSRMRPTHSLEGNVVAMYGDNAGSGGPMAVLEIQFFLFAEKDRQAEVALSNTIRKTVPIPETEPMAVAAGLDEALQQILTEFEEAARAAMANPTRKQTE